jgi:hypothetical protein
MFKRPDPIPIFFYQDGLMIEGFSFYPYQSKQAQSILSDILEGYFPYDLKAKYPEGVPLKPVDQCEKTHFDAETAGQKSFKGKPMREELEKKFRESGTINTNKLNANEPIILDTHVKEGTEASEVVTLRIRTETGNRNIILKLLLTDTIDAVYKLVEPFSEFKGEKPFELRTSFPNKAYLPQNPQTLKELGLAPSSVLMMR